jgi:hypothetical protein
MFFTGDYCVNSNLYSSVAVSSAFNALSSK